MKRVKLCYRLKQLIEVTYILSWLKRFALQIKSNYLFFLIDADKKIMIKDAIKT